ncbi:MAG: biopolymer transporter ExbD, partial [Planctomycetes bacterium]|nr:biopolymer transporter ExbD [Planctomycetota bacterium]
PKKKDFDGEFDITPMIDVVLLLLIFFMVSARMAPQNAAKLPRAKHGEMAAMHDSVVLVVRANSNDTASVSTLAGKTFSSDREQQSAEIAEYVNEGLQLREKKSVLIQAEPNVLTAEIVRIQNAIGSVLEPEQKILVAVEH